MSQYLYRPLYRPAHQLGTLPRGLDWHYAEAPALDPLIAVRLKIPVSIHPHGVIACTRPLTAEEQYNFDLQPA